MSQYYNPRLSPQYRYSPGKTFKISRSKIDLFRECPRCFYLDRRRGVRRPPGYPFSLNSAVDLLLKKEFDTHRADGTPHPLMMSFGIDAIPFAHPDLDVWRENFKGVQYLHEPTNLIITGAVDDVWINNDDELIVVDYKSTAKDGEVTIDAPWQIAYKRQMEVYQWLLRRNGFTVSDTGYFVYCNGVTDKDEFDNRLEFDVSVLPYTGSDDWIEGTLQELHACLIGDEIPDMNEECDYCLYRKELADEESWAAYSSA